MNNVTQDVQLIVEVNNKKPIELLDLTKSLLALSNQFNRHVSEFGDSQENREAKLYVKEIKTGSVIVHLVELTPLVIPFIGNFNSIVSFGGHCKKVFDYFLKSKGEKPNLTPTDFKELAALLHSTAKDNGAQLQLNLFNYGTIENLAVISSTEANAFENIARIEAGKLNQPENIQGDIKNVLFYWHIAKNDIKSTTGYKGIIEEISNKPMNVSFGDNEVLKKQMLHDEAVNPFTKMFEVDVALQTVQGEIAVYKILKLHETFDREK